MLYKSWQTTDLRMPSPITDEEALASQISRISALPAGPAGSARGGHRHCCLDAAIPIASWGVSKNALCCAIFPSPTLL